MTRKIRLGVVGANPNGFWAPRSHLPAILASPEYELTAVCTTRPESVEAARQKYGARLAFHNYEEMAASPEIEAVAVVVRVPSHYGPTKAALEAGKHVYTEWPLGRTTAEAMELAALAKAKGVRTAIGLQSRVNPGLMYMKDLVEDGYVGEIVSCRASLVRDGVLERMSDRTWQSDVTLGANDLTISNGHTIDTLRFVVGDFTHVTSLVTTRIRQWLETDTGRMVDVTSPDTVLTHGRLANGGVASVHFASAPWAGSGYRIEVYGRKGTLAGTTEEPPQTRRGPVYGPWINRMRLEGAQGNNELQPLDVPTRYTYVPAGMPEGMPYNVGQMYHEFAKAIGTGQGNPPDFDTAVELHHLIDAIRYSSETNKEVAVGTSE